MTSRYLRVLAVGGMLFLAAPASGFAETPALAQGVATETSVQPGLLTKPVTDDAGVLTDSERAEIEQAIH